MELLYAWMQHLLPFEWARYTFMLNALLGVLLVTPLFGLLGTMVVNNQMAFFSDAIGHSALTGIAIGVILGFHDPLGAMLVFSVILAIGISKVKELSTSSPDTIIGAFAAMAMALGIVILSRGGGFASYSRYLIGDLLSITPGQIILLFLTFLSVIVYWSIIFNKLLLVSLNTSLAQSRGINVKLIEMSFSILMAIIVTMSIQWVGILIINSLLVLPAAAARNLAGNVRQYHSISIFVSVLCGLVGLILSYYWGTATGATIVLCSAVVFILSFIFKFQQ